MQLKISPHFTYSCHITCTCYNELCVCCRRIYIIIYSTNYFYFIYWFIIYYYTNIQMYRWNAKQTVSISVHLSASLTTYFWTRKTYFSSMYQRSKYPKWYGIGKIPKCWQFYGPNWFIQILIWERHTSGSYRMHLKLKKKTKSSCISGSQKIERILEHFSDVRSFGRFVLSVLFLSL